MGNSKTKPEQSDTKETESTNQPSPYAPLYPQLQIRNCIRNVRGNNSNFADMYPNEAGTSCGGANQSGSVYTIDVHRSTPSNFTNTGYVPTESGIKSQSNDGLPTYEEAISGIKSPIASPAAPVVMPTVDLVNEEDASNGSASRGRRHRHRHRRHHHHDSVAQNENDQPDAPEENRRHRHRRGGFRLKRHLAKINRRNNPETE